MAAAKGRGGDGLISRRLLVLLAAAGALNPMNTTLIAPALVSLRADTGATAGQVAWIVSALYLASAVGQPFWGRVSDVFGPRRATFGGLLLLITGGCAPLASDELWVLVVGRCLLGAGTAAMFPAAMAILSRRAARAGVGVPGSALGVLNGAAMVTLGAGPMVGGLFVNFLDWRWVFYVNVPVAIALAPFIWRWVPRDLDVDGSRRSLRFDVPGAVCFLGCLAGLMLLLNDIPQFAWGWGLVAVGSGVALLLIERGRTDPFIDVASFARSKQLRAMYVWAVLMFVPNYVALFGISQWMQEDRGLTPTVVGVVTASMFAVSAVVSLVAGRRFRLHRTMVLAIVPALGAAAVLLTVTSDSAVVVIVGVFVLLGTSIPFVVMTTQGTVSLYAPPDAVGVAAGLARTAQYIGAVVASSVVAASFESQPGDAGLHLLAGGIAAASVLALLVTISGWRRDRRSGV